MADIVQNETGSSNEGSEFGDFQTSEQPCNNFDKSVIENPTKTVQPMMNSDKTVHHKQPQQSKSKNMFAAGVDWNQFREFRQLFEMNIAKHFQSGQQPPLSSEHETSNDTREDPINDCLIWQNLTTTCDINLYLKPDKSFVLKRFLENCLEQIENRKMTIKKNQRHPSNESLRCWNEDEIAQSLDMHSMMIGGDVPETDDIIGKQEGTSSNKLVQINRFNDGGAKFQHHQSMNRCKIDQSLLSLNASTLLKTFHDEYGLGGYNDDIDEKNNDNDDDEQNPEQDVDDSQYYSLPINLNHSNNHSKSTQKAPKSSLIGRKYSNDYSNDGLIRELAQIQIHHNPDGSYEYCLDKIPIIRTIKKDEQYSSKELSEKIAQLNYITQLQSDVLQMELSTRNDLEYEKELKNQFISLLLRVQNKRRNHLKNAAKFCDNAVSGGRAPTTTITTNKIAIIKHLSLDSILPMFHGSHGILKKHPTSPKHASSTSCDPNFKPIYLIPYIDTMFPLDVQTLQTLIEILVAMDNDSRKVPELITNYILKVICPA